MAALVNPKKHLRKEECAVLCKLFQTTEEEGILSKSLHEATIVLIQKPDGENERKKIYTE